MLRKYHLIVFFENSRIIHLSQFLKYFASFVNAKERLPIYCVEKDLLLLPKIHDIIVSFIRKAHAQPANIGPQDVLRKPPSNVLTTSRKDPIWHSQGRLDLTSRRRLNRTSWGRPEMTPRGHPNLTFEGRRYKVGLGRPQGFLSTFLRRPSEYPNLDVQFCFLTFLSELIPWTKSF